MLGWCVFAVIISTTSPLLSSDLMEEYLPLIMAPVQWSPKSEWMA